MNRGAKISANEKIILMFHIIISERLLKSNKNAKKLKIVENTLSAAGKEYVVHRTTSAEEPKKITTEITSGEGNVIIAMCGDGTLHSILNGFVNFDENFLGLIPLGTGNDFATSANIPHDVKKAMDIILSSPPRPIDFIQFSSGLRSLNAAGMGIDVDVLKRVYEGNHKGKSKYLRSLLVCLTKFKSYDFTAVYDGKEEEHRGLLAAVGNGRQIGGGIKICPNASIDDGYMDLCICDYISKFKIIFAFLKLMRGKVNGVKQITAVKVKEVKFIPHGNYTVQLDGELYDNVQIEAKVEHAKLKFFKP